MSEPTAPATSVGDVGLNATGSRIEELGGEDVVETTSDGRADQLTVSREIWSPATLFHGAARWWLAAAAMIAFAGIVLRVIVLRSPAAELNGDEAYTGIQSFEILDGGWPVVLGGEFYTLPFESYLYAPFVAVFGAQILPLKLLSTMFWVVAGAIVALIGTRLRGRRTGLLAAALLWITPGGMLLLSVTAYIAYSSGMLVTLVAFFLAMRIIDVDDTPGWMLGSFGVVAGFGFWLHPMYLATLVPMVIAVLLVRRRPSAWAWVIGGGIAGCAPFLLWNVVNGFPSLGSPVNREDTYLDRLGGFGSDLMPRAFGLRDFFLAWEINTVVGPLLYLGMLALTVFGLVRLVRQSADRSRFLLPAVILAAFPIMAIFENLIYAADGRYGVITYPFIVLAAAVGIDELMGRTTRRAVVAAGGIFAVWLAGFVLPGVWPLAERNYAGPHDGIAEVVGRLDDAGIDRIAGSYWGVHPVEFAADRRIVAAVTPGWAIRFPEHQRIVEGSPPETVAFVFRLDNESPEQLWMPIEDYGREEIGGFALYLPEPALGGAVD